MNRKAAQLGRVPRRDYDRWRQRQLADRTGEHEAALRNVPTRLNKVQGRRRTRAEKLECLARTEDTSFP